MTVTAGSDVKKFVKQVGVAKVGVMAMPKWGNGPYAGKLGSTSQTVGHHRVDEVPARRRPTSSCSCTRPERMAAWFKTTGAFPADDRFNTKLITLPQQKVLFDLVKNGLSVPRELHPAGARREGRASPSRSCCSAATPTAAKAAAATEKIAQRIRLTQRKQMANFKKWSASYR